MTQTDIKSIYATISGTAFSFPESALDCEIIAI